MREFIRVLALAAAACACVAPAGAQTYDCVVFPKPFDGAVIEARKLNNLGKSVGSVGGGANRRAAIFRADGTLEYLHTSPSAGAHINDSGNAVFTQLDGANGMAVGLIYYDAASNTARSVGVPRDFSGVLGAGGIDDANTIYGTTQITGVVVPFKIDSGGFTDLSALLINDSSTVVGRWVPGPTNRLTGFVVVGKTAYSDVRVSSTHEYSEVAAVNAAGDAVGYSAEFPGAPAVPFLWRAGTLTLLGCPGRQMGATLDINDQGVILDGWGALLVPTTPPPN